MANKTNQKKGETNANAQMNAGMTKNDTFRDAGPKSRRSENKDLPGRTSNQGRTEGTNKR